MSVTYKPIDWIDWLPPHLYRVGDDGTVWRWKEGQKSHRRRYPPRWQKMRTFTDKSMHAVRLGHANRKTTRSVAALVLTAFKGPPPAGHEAIRKDDTNKADNRLTNLAWAHKGFTLKGRPKPELIGNRRTAKLALADIPTIFRYRREGWTLAEIAEEFRVNTRTIADTLEGKSHQGVECDRTPPASNLLAQRGSRANGAKLIEPEIPEIKKRYWSGEQMKDIAQDFEVSPTTISDIINGKTWGHVR